MSAIFCEDMKYTMKKFINMLRNLLQLELFLEPLYIHVQYFELLLPKLCHKFLISKTERWQIKSLFKSLMYPK